MLAVANAAGPQILIDADSCGIPMRRLILDGFTLLRFGDDPMWWLYLLDVVRWHELRGDKPTLDRLNGYLESWIYRHVEYVT